MIKKQEKTNLYLVLTNSKEGGTNIDLITTEYDIAQRRYDFILEAKKDKSVHIAYYNDYLIN